MKKKNKLTSIISFASIILVLLFANTTVFGEEEKRQRDFGGSGGGTIVQVLNYDANGGTGTPPAEVREVEGTIITLAENPFTKPSFVFDGWNTESDGTGIPYAENSSYALPMGNTILYATWKEATNSPTQYNVFYHANGGSGVAPVESPKNVNDKFNAAANTFTGETAFLYWNTQANGEGTTYYSGDEITMQEGDIHLYAIWKAKTSNPPTDSKPTDSTTAAENIVAKDKKDNSSSQNITTAVPQTGSSDLVLAFICIIITSVLTGTYYLKRKSA